MERYEEGQALRFVRVRFPGHIRSYPFLVGRQHLAYGQKVMALSDRGMALGHINSFPYEISYHKGLEPLKTIARVATPEDESSLHQGDDREKAMAAVCREFIEKYSLDMNLTHVELTSHGRKGVFYFTAPKRVDFRQLLKDLVADFKMEVELRQISARERAAALGGLGPCGRALCCSTFLRRYGNVSMKMAKVQNLSLVPAKLNGLCGQLKCCLSYEDDVYKDKRTRLPKEGQFIKALNGDQGKVLRLHVFKEQFDMLTDKGAIHRYQADLFDPDPQGHSPSEGWQMPSNFEHISQNTSVVIGPQTPENSSSSPKRTGKR